MKNNKKFSIIVPVKPGHEKYLKHCLYSVIAQDYTNWEIIVVFDGENPFGKEICKQLQNRYDIINHLI